MNEEEEKYWDHYIRALCDLNYIQPFRKLIHLILHNIKELQDEIGEFGSYASEEEVEEIREEISELQSIIDELKETKANEEDLEDAVARIEALENCCEEVKELINELTGGESSLSEKVSALEEETETLEEIKADKVDFENFKEDTEEKFSELDKCCEEVKEELEKINDILDEYGDDIEDLKNHEVYLTSKNGTMATEDFVGDDYLNYSMSDILKAMSDKHVMKYELYTMHYDSQDNFISQIWQGIKDVYDYDWDNFGFIEIDNTYYAGNQARTKITVIPRERDVYIVLDWAGDEFTGHCFLHRTDLQELKDRVKELEARADENDETNTEQNERLEQLEDDMEKTGERLTNIDAKNEEQDERLNAIDNKNEEEDKEIEDLEDEVKEDEEKIASNTERIETLENCCEEVNSTINDINNNINDINSNIESIEAKNEEQDEEIEKIKQDIADAEEAFSKADEEMEERISELENCCDEVKIQITAIETTANNALNIAEQASDQASEAIGTANTANSTAIEALEKASAAEASTAGAQEAAEKATEAAQEATEAAEKATEAVEGLSEDIDEIKEQVDTNTEAISGIQEEVNTNSEAISGIQEQVDTNTESIENLESCCEEVQSTLSEYDDRITTAQDTADEAYISLSANSLALSQQTLIDPMDNPYISGYIQLDKENESDIVSFGALGEITLDTSKQSDYLYKISVTEYGGCHKEGTSDGDRYCYNGINTTLDLSALKDIDDNLQEQINNLNAAGWVLNADKALYSTDFDWATELFTSVGTDNYPNSYCEALAHIYDCRWNIKNSEGEYVLYLYMSNSGSGRNGEYIKVFRPGYTSETIYSEGTHTLIERMSYNGHTEFVIIIYKIVGNTNSMSMDYYLLPFVKSDEIDSGFTYEFDTSYGLSLDFVYTETSGGETTGDSLFNKIVYYGLPIYFDNTKDYGIGWHLLKVYFSVSGSANGETFNYSDIVSTIPIYIIDTDGHFIGNGNNSMMPLITNNFDYWEIELSNSLTPSFSGWLYTYAFIKCFYNKTTDSDSLSLSNVSYEIE